MIWQEFVTEGHTAEAAGDTNASQVHSMIGACDDYRTAVDDDWMKIADWYSPGSSAPRGNEGAPDLYREHIKKVSK